MSGEVGTLKIEVQATAITTATNRMEGFVKACESLEARLLKTQGTLNTLTQTFAKLAAEITPATTGVKAMADPLRQTNQAMEAGARVASKYANALKRMAENGAQAKSNLPGGTPAGPGGGGGGGMSFPGGALGMLSLGSGGLSASAFLRVNPAVAAGAMAFQALGSAAASAAGQVKDVTLAVIDASMKFDALRSILAATTQNEQQAGDMLKYVVTESQRLGLPLESVTKEFGKFYAAASSKFDDTEIKKVFTSVSQAARVMNLSAADTAGVYKALTDMISKGKISMEELRRQLGNRLPGAFQVAAQAMGVTTKQLDEMVRKGSLTVEKFLVPFSEALDKKFAKGLDAATNNLQSFVNRVENSMIILGATIGDKLGIKAGALEVLRGFYDALEDIQKAVEKFANSPAGKEFAAWAKTLGESIADAAREFGAFTATLLGTNGTAMSTFMMSLVGGFELLRGIVETITHQIAALFALVKSMGKGFGIVGGMGEAVEELSKSAESFVKIGDRMAKAAGRFRLNLFLADFNKMAGGLTAPTKKPKDDDSSGIDKEAQKLRELIRVMEESILVAKQMKSVANEDKFPTASGYVKQFVASKHFGALPGADGGMQLTARDALGASMLKQADAVVKNAEAFDRREAKLKESMKAEKEWAAFVENTLSAVAKKGIASEDDMLARGQALWEANMQGKISWEQLAEGLKYYYETLDKAGRAEKAYEEKKKHFGQSMLKRSQAPQEMAEEIKMWMEFSDENSLDPEVIGRVLDEIKNKYDDTFKAITTTIENSMNKAGDALAEFAMTGKLDWKSFTLSVMSDIMRMIIQIQIIQPILEQFKAGAGKGTGFGGFLAGLFGARASGGPISAGGSYLVGEKGPELITPSRNGYVHPTGSFGGGGSPTIGNLSIDVTIQGGGSSQSSGSGMGNDLARGMKGALDSYIVEQLRPGGLLYNRR